MADPTRARKATEESPDTGVSWRLWVLIAAVVIFAVIAIQNSQSVDVKLLFIDANTPLIFALLLAGALGAIIGYVGPVVRRHNRAQRRLDEDR